MFVCAGFLAACSAKSGRVEQLRTHLEQNGWDAAEPPAFFEEEISKAEARDAASLLASVWRTATRERYESVWKQKSFIRDGLQMRFDYRLFGEKPKDGRSLYISMHGGGNCPSYVNTQQWRNQVQLYQPEEGLYVAPRAPWDDWDMWFKPGMDELLENLIAAAVALEDVNPDKVYLLGYSAGGDGVWRLAPRMADHWAAASMMAGHPGDVSLVNLRNLPYMIWMGENDTAYDRNVLAAKRGRELDSLRQADPEGYVHETHIVAGKGHWMDREDAAAIPWMSKFTRQTFPAKVVWRQGDVARPSFYWLKVDAAEAKPGMEVRVSRKGNEFVIERCDYDRLTICLNDEMADLDRPVVVKYNGETVFSGQARRTMATLARSLEERGDCRQMFSAEIALRLR